jgi:hypothetical protein
MRARSLGLALLFVGGAAGAALARRPLDAPAGVTFAPVPPTVVAAAGPAPADDESRRSPGPPKSALGIAAVPARLARTSHGEALEIEVRIANQSASPARAKYAFEVLDDRGAGTMKPAISSPIGLDVDAAHTARLVTPAGLADGYYAARVTVAFHGAADQTVDSRTVYFLVERGDITPIDELTFDTESRFREGQ